MKFVILAAMAAVAVAAPQYSYYVPPEDSSEEIKVVPVPAPPADSSEEVEVVPIHYIASDESSEEVELVPIHYIASDESSEEVEVVPIHYLASDESSEEVEVVPILKDVRVHEENGRYNFEVETGNGIRLSQIGTPNSFDGAVNKAGEYSYTAPDGTPVVVKFVADANGYQPQSDLLPVAPAFPHPIPQFVLDQIAFAAQEDAARARAGGFDSSEEAEAPAPVPTPSRHYGQPQ